MTLTVADLAVRAQVTIEPGSPAEARALAVLTDTANVADALAGPFPDPVPTVVEAVVYEAAKRTFLNPDGMRSENLGSYSYTREADRSGLGAFTDHEVRILRRAAGTGGLGTMRINLAGAIGLTSAPDPEVRYGAVDVIP